MAYFIVLPLFFAWLIVSFIALTVVRVKAPEWRGRNYLFHASIWSSVGVLAANAFLIASLWFGANFIGASSGNEATLQNFARIVWGVAAILGPLFASAIGWFVGMLVGLVIAHGRIQNVSA
jgi:hypothetical protein